MASVRKIQNKKGISYKIEVSNGYDVNGKKIRETATFVPEPGMTAKQAEKAARKFADEFEDRVKNGGSISGEKMTLEAFIGEWLKTYAPAQLEVTTLRLYEDVIRKHVVPALGHMKIGKIKTYHVEKLFISLSQDGARIDGNPGGYSINTIKTVRTAFSSALTNAERLGIIEENPVHKAKLPKLDGDEKIRCFTLDETRRFLEFVDTDYEDWKNRNSSSGGTVIEMHSYTNEDALKMQYRAFFQIALLGGLRRGEIVALEWKNIDFGKNLIHVKQSAYRTEDGNGIKAPKTRSSFRSVALPPPVMGLLKEYRDAQDRYRRCIGDRWKGGDWVFIAEDGTNISVNSPYNKFRRLLAKYNKRVPDEEKLPLISLHDLRHTNASLLVRSNKADIKSISAKLGHADPGITMKYYVHSYEEAEAETAEILDEMVLKNNAKVAK